MKKIILLFVMLLAVLAFAACTDSAPEDVSANEVGMESTPGEAEDDTTEVENDIYEPEGDADWTQEEMMETLMRWAAEIPGYMTGFSSDWRWYHTLQEATDHAADIVRVEVVDDGRLAMVNGSVGHSQEQMERWLRESPDMFLHTVHWVRVLEVFQGDLQPGDMIEVAQHGGEIEEYDVLVETDSRIPLAMGDDLIMFLMPQYDHPDLRGRWIPRTLLGPFFGIYRFDTLSDGMRAHSLDDTVERADEDILPHIQEQLFPLTIGDLANLQFQNFGRVSESFEALLTEEARAALR